MLFKKIIDIIKILIFFEYRRAIYFPIDTITNVVSKILYLLVNMVFWYVLIDSNSLMTGWSYSNIIVFVAFSELFYGLDASIFSLSSRFWRTIHSGQLDNLLVRPFDPRVRFIVVNIDYVTLFVTFVEFIVLLFLSKLMLDIQFILLGMIIVLLANVIVANIRFTLSYLCFWHGRMDAITEVSDSFNILNKYPLTIMPKSVQFIFQFIVPFYFFSTFSAELVVNALSNHEMITIFWGLITNIVIWTAISNYVWKKGLSRYESING